MGVVYGIQTVARGELIALLTAAQLATKYQPPRQAEFVTDASYVIKVVKLIREVDWKSMAHKLANIDIITELDNVWNHELFTIKKIESHRTFQSAQNHDDLWCIAGNFCADLTATAALRTIPHDIRKLADDIAVHVKHEEDRFKYFLNFLATCNMHRLEATKNLGVDTEHTTTMQVPRRHESASDGFFPAQAMGDDALNFMKQFNPGGYVKYPPVECSDDVFSCCLQGANIAKATKIWLETLAWPSDMENEDPPDWGITWFELAVSFYLSTGRRFPVKLHGAGNKSVYAEYDSDES